jgi:hypothetical protein
MELERLQILKMLESGRIDAEEAATLLAALNDAAPVAAPKAGREGKLPPFSKPAAPVTNPWAGFWVLALVAGLAVLFFGALIVSLVYATSGAWGFLLCGWPLTLLGLLVVILAIWSRRATWMHLRISEGGRRKITLSFPLPLTLAAWVMRMAQPFIPQLQDTGVDDLIIALRDSAAQGEPLVIDVEDDEAGERVQLYIG